MADARNKMYLASVTKNDLREDPKLDEKVK
jgi:hypothetical protein